MVILGISAYYHDSSAALLVDGKIVAAIQEERISRVKHDNRFPSQAITWCLESVRYCIDDIDAIVFYEKPFLKFERILESMVHTFPKSYTAFTKVVPSWLHQKLNMRRTIQKELSVLFGKTIKVPISFVEHHLAHAAFAYYSSPYMDSAILVMDAVGEHATTSLMYGKGDDITVLYEQHYPHSFGILYSAVTQFLGFNVNSDEYKVMGLAPYGEKSNLSTKYITLIKENIVELKLDGSLLLNLDYFCFTYGFSTIKQDKWEKLFLFPKREPKEAINENHMALAYAIQAIANEYGIELARKLKKITNATNLCITGGCALNCVMNGAIKEASIFESCFVPFEPGDGGCSIGAALALYQKHLKDVTPFVGSWYSDYSNCNTACLDKGKVKYYSSFNQLIDDTAQLLFEGNIVGWFQDRMEFSPRALGNRCILANCINPEMKSIINKKVKFRELFRPFAPVVKEEDASRFFSFSNSPYMMFTAKVKEGSIPAVTHVDNTARVQTVNIGQNEKLYRLISAYEKLTGIPVLLNTSFNLMGEPIVNSLNDAISTFNRSGIDVLVLGNYMIKK